MAIAFSRSVSEIIENTSPRGQSFDSIDFLRAMQATEQTAFRRASQRTEVSGTELQEHLEKVVHQFESDGMAVSFFGVGRLTRYPFSQELIEALAQGGRIADRLGSLSVDTHHIALGMLRTPNCLAHLVLRDTLDETRWEQELKAYGDLDLEPEETFECARCNFVSPAPYLFQHAPNANHCLRCVQKAAPLPGDFLLVPIALIFVGALMARGGEVAWLPILANVLLYLIFRYPAAWLHEFGHFLAARAVGFDIAAIQIGCGEPKFRTQVMGYPVLLGPMPSYVRTRVFPVTSQGYRWRTTLYLLGGPLISLLLALAVFGTVPDFLNQQIAIFPGFMFFLANLAVGLPTLLPFRTAAGQESDGAALIRAWKESFQPFEKSASHRFAQISRALSQMTLNKYEAAALERLMKLYPDDRSLEAFKSLANLDFISDEEIHPQFQAIGSLAASWKLVFEGEPEKGLSGIDQSLREQPRNHFAQAARCCALLALGRGAETVETLRKLVRDPAMVSRAWVLAMAWYAEQKYGSTDRAELMKSSLRVLDPQGVTLRWDQVAELVEGNVSL